MRRRKALTATLTIGLAAIAGCVGDEDIESQENTQSETDQDVTESQEGSNEGETPEGVTQRYVQASIDGDLDTVREIAYPPIEESLLGALYGIAEEGTENGSEREHIRINSIEQISPREFAEKDDLDDIDSAVEREKTNIQNILERVDSDDVLEEFTYVITEILFEADSSEEETEEIVYIVIKTANTGEWTIVTRM